MMILDLLDDLLLPFLQFANEQCTEAEEVTNIGLLITFDMTWVHIFRCLFYLGYGMLPL